MSSTPFIDRVHLKITAGDGGDGCLSFRREKFIEFGGPDGADGGRGGDVFLEATTDMATLLDLAHRPHFKGERGLPGKGKNKTGAAGAESVVRVPVGTVVFRRDDSGERLQAADLCEKGQRFLAARGGRGGRGNLSFKTRFYTAPRISEKGEPGEQASLDLELKLIADVGLVGLPNAGKSTFLARVSAARPKIADYPFTTLSPNLGVVSHKGVQFTVADIPGLIEGAHAGKGLGTEFLRHVERTRMLVHLVDPFGFEGEEAGDGVKAVERELGSFSRELLRKPRLFAVNKTDLPGSEAGLKALRRRFRGRETFAISAATGAGLRPLLDRLIRELAKARAATPRSPATPFPRPSSTGGPPGWTPVAGMPLRQDGPSGREEARRPSRSRVQAGFHVSSLGGGKFRLEGPFVTRAAAMLKVELPEAIERFQRTLKRIGVDRALRVAGIQEGDLVSCGKFEFEWSDRPDDSGPTSRRLSRTERRMRRELGGAPGALAPGEDLPGRGKEKR